MTGAKQQNQQPMQVWNVVEISEKAFNLDVYDDKYVCQ